jgi:hypothetical protein
MTDLSARSNSSTTGLLTMANITGGANITPCATSTPRKRAQGTGSGRCGPAHCSSTTLVAASAMLHCWLVVASCLLLVVVSVVLSRKEDTGMPPVETS